MMICKRSAHVAKSMASDLDQLFDGQAVAAKHQQATAQALSASSDANQSTDVNECTLGNPLTVKSIPPNQSKKKSVRFQSGCADQRGAFNEASWPVYEHGKSPSSKRKEQNVVAKNFKATKKGKPKENLRSQDKAVQKLDTRMNDQRNHSQVCCAQQGTHTTWKNECCYSNLHTLSGVRLPVEDSSRVSPSLPVATATATSGHVAQHSSYERGDSKPNATIILNPQKAPKVSTVFCSTKISNQNSRVHDSKFDACVSTCCVQIRRVAPSITVEDYDSRVQLVLAPSRSYYQYESCRPPREDPSSDEGEHTRPVGRRQSWLSHISDGRRETFSSSTDSGDSLVRKEDVIYMFVEWLTKIEKLCMVGGPALRGGFVGQEGAFFLELHQEVDLDDIEIDINGPSNDEPWISVTQLDETLYEAKYVPRRSGRYEITITYQLLHLLGSPFTFDVLDPDRA